MIERLTVTLVLSTHPDHAELVEISLNNLPLVWRSIRGREEITFDLEITEIHNILTVHPTTNAHPLRIRDIKFYGQTLGLDGFQGYWHRDTGVTVQGVTTILDGDWRFEFDSPVNHFRTLII